MATFGSIDDVLEGRADAAVVCGDAAEVMKLVRSGSVHVVYCDPPYGLSDQALADVLECLRCWLAGEPYVHDGDGFMGEEWDGFVPGPEAWKEAHRALKPGGMLVAFSSTRTVDLLGLALRLADFQIREGWSWIFGSGMAKGMDVSKGIDDAAGAVREVVGTKVGLPGYSLAPHRGRTVLRSASDKSFSSPERECAVTAPATDLAREWSGYRTGVKPAHEPIVVARKVPDGTIAENVARHGCGALNVDAARIASGGASPSAARRETARRSGNAPVQRGASPSGWDDRTDAAKYTAVRPAESLGRMASSVAMVHLEGCEVVGVRRVKAGTAVNRNRDPASKTSCFGTRAPQTEDAGYAGEDGREEVEEWECAPGCPVAGIGEQGDRSASRSAAPRSGRIGDGWGMTRTGAEYDDDGTVARYFYQTKARGRDRLAHLTCSPGCPEHGAVRALPDAWSDAKRVVADARVVDGVFWPLDEPEAYDGCPRCLAPRQVYAHPTVKPSGLARHHAALLSLPASVRPVALVPYCGSGVEARALADAGFRVIAIDLHERHCAMTRHRLAAPAEGAAPKPARRKRPDPPPAQLSIFDRLPARQNDPEGTP